MIDHVLGRPSTAARKYQVLLVVSVWLAALYRGNRDGPKPLRRLSEILSRKFSAWQTIVLTFLAIYASRNFDALAGLESPEPLANLYSPAFFRATWVTTALDAGYWSAMRIRNKAIREVVSLVFSLYYLIAAERADAKVRQIRSALTVEHLRVSWNKGTTGILGTLSSLVRPRMTSFPPRALRLPRPPGSIYTTPVSAWLYFDGPLTDLARHTRVVLDVPGGGFVAMSPRSYDDKLLSWAGRLGIPILSIDYSKAPEFPYPHALHECFDAYRSVVETRGRSIGLSGETVPRIIVSGDSAGGNLAVGMTLMTLVTSLSSTKELQTDAVPLPISALSGIPPGLQTLPPPDGIVLVYPSLNMNIANWMTEEQMQLIGDRRARQTNKPVLRQKTDEYRRIAVFKLGVNEDAGASDSDMASAKTKKEPVPAPRPMRLATSSIISYFNDRILTPEMMRSMILLYIGSPQDGRPIPSFKTDYFLSSVLTPDILLERFPSTRILTGERDPLVDDTVIFAGRIRAARRAKRQRECENWDSRDESINNSREEKMVQVSLIPSISHGFLNIVAMFPDGWKYVHRCSEWIADLLHARDLEILSEQTSKSRYGSGYHSMTGSSTNLAGRHHSYHFPDYRSRSQATSVTVSGSENGDDPDEVPLEMARGPHGRPGQSHSVDYASARKGGLSPIISKDSLSDSATLSPEKPILTTLANKKTGLSNGMSPPRKSGLPSSIKNRTTTRPRLSAAALTMNNGHLSTGDTGMHHSPLSSSLSPPPPTPSGSSMPLPSTMTSSPFGRSGREPQLRTSRPPLDRNLSIHSLASQEDLLERRMEGLTIPLMGMPTMPPSADEAGVE